MGTVTQVSSAPRTPVVVYADDDRITREYLGGLLRGHGWTVETVGSGQQALDRASQGGVDLVMLDLVMPGIDGIQACRLIKSMQGEQFLPVMLVTSRSDIDSRIEGLRIGADEYVCKPFDERELVARCEAMLRIKRSHDQLAELNAQFQRLSVRDEVTGLYNYRHLQTRLGEEFSRAERYHDPLACMMMDIDGFDELNEAYGQAVGDAVLALLAQRIRAALREVDVVARYGSDDFLMLLPSTHFAGALAVAERIWSGVRERPLQVEQRQLPVTVSIGVALFPSRDIKGKDELVQSADRALRQAKADGQDCICIFQHQGYIYRPR